MADMVGMLLLPFVFVLLIAWCVAHAVVVQSRMVRCRVR